MNNRLALVISVFVLLALALAGCGGGGDQDEIRVTSINVNPAAVTAGSVITLTASISAPGQSVSSLVKNWTVTAGSLTAEPPDFSLLLRQTARDVSAGSLSTTSDTVYWVAPATATATTISVAVADQSKSLQVAVGNSPVTLSVSNGVCTVSASNITDLYQVAFRINYSSAWTPVSVVPGNFLGVPHGQQANGADPEVLWIGMTNRNGFVPVALTRLGNADGVDGSGTLATITFSKGASSASSREVADVPFELGMLVLYDSSFHAINIP